MIYIKMAWYIYNATLSLIVNTVMFLSWKKQKFSEFSSYPQNHFNKEIEKNVNFLF